MKRIVLFILVVGTLTTSVSACKKKTAPGEPTPGLAATFVFNAIALPANEIPAVSNSENTGRGFVSVTLRVTRDGSGTITSGKMDYGISVTSFPSTVNFTNMHIHEGDSTVPNGTIRVISGLANGEFQLVNGAGSITKTNNDVSAALAQSIINTPAGFYFNIHSTANGGGVARGQLFLVQQN